MATVNAVEAALAQFRESGRADYKGYEIALSNSAGGKAGRGHNVTATVQVREPFNDESYLLKKQIRFKTGTGGGIAAFHKAVKFVDEFKGEKLI